MPNKNDHWEDLLAFLKENRSNETNFENVLQKLSRECSSENNRDKNGEGYINELQMIKDKYAAEYQQTKEISGSAWPEYERFITQFERVVTAEMNK